MPETCRRAPSRGIILAVAEPHDATRPSGADYCPFYCEENIWHLCSRAVRDADARSQLSVLFITNGRRHVALWNQRAGQGSEGLVLWDYHVVMLERRDDGWRVWDLDTRLPLPTNAADYLEQTFRPVPPAYAPCFRLVPAAEYLSGFASDRRHMRAADGRPLQPPPSWPPIGAGHNLERWLDLSDRWCGEVLELPELVQRVGVTNPSGAPNPDR